MDFLSAIGSPTPKTGIGVMSNEAGGTGESGDAFQAIMGELSETGAQPTGTDGAQGAVQAAALLKSVAKAAGAILPDGTIDLGALARITGQPFDVLTAGGDASAVAGQADAESIDLTALLTADTMIGEDTLTGGAGKDVVADMVDPASAGVDPASPLTVAPLPAQIAAGAGLKVVATADTTAAETSVDPSLEAAAAPTAEPGIVPGTTQTGRGRASDKAGKATGKEIGADATGPTGGPELPGKAAGSEGPTLAAAAGKGTSLPTEAAEPSAEAAADAIDTAAFEDAAKEQVAKRGMRNNQEAEAAERRRADGADATEIAGKGAAAASKTNPAPTAPTAEAVQQGGAAAVAQSTAAASSGGAGNGSSDKAPDRDRAAEALAAGAITAPESQKVGTTEFAQHLAAAKAQRTSAPVPPAPMQVAVQVQRAVGNGLERVSIQLRPVELGRIDVQMEFGGDGVMRAKFIAENPQTLELLQRDFKTLGKALEEAGIRTDNSSLSFSLRDDSRSANQNQQQGKSARSGGTGFTLDADAVIEPQATAERYQRVAAAGRVDVRV